MKKNRFVDSFNYALEGLIYVLRSQRNMRLHFMTAVLILLVCVYLNLSKIELLIVLLAVSFVLFAEMMNTAVEFTVDLVSNKVNPLSRVIKDISAGAVLVSSVNALIAGYVVFSRHLNIPLENMSAKIKESPWHMTFIALILVLSLVIIGKMLLHRGTPLRGGMPSGHAALAFAIWAAILLYSGDSFVVILAFVLAFFVARSRVSSSIHSVMEAISGSALGILVTMLVFQLLK